MDLIVADMNHGKQKSLSFFFFSCYLSWFQAEFRKFKIRKNPGWKEGIGQNFQRRAMTPSRGCLIFLLLLICIIMEDGRTPGASKGEGGCVIPPSPLSLFL